MNTRISKLCSIGRVYFFKLKISEVTLLESVFVYSVGATQAGLIITGLKFLITLIFFPLSSCEPNQSIFSNENPFFSDLGSIFALLLSSSA